MSRDLPAPLVASFTLLTAAAAATAGASQLRASIGSSEPPQSSGYAIRVEQGVDEPDLAIITLGGPRGLELADGIDVGAGVSRPVVVGSLWDSDDRCRGDRPDEP